MSVYYQVCIIIMDSWYYAPGCFFVGIFIPKLKMQNADLPHEIKCIISTVACHLHAFKF